MEDQINNSSTSLFADLQTKMIEESLVQANEYQEMIQAFYNY